MRFLAWLDTPLVNRLSQALNGSHVLHATPYRDEFLQRLGEEAVDVAVIDPSLAVHGARDIAASIASPLLAIAPRAAVIVYSHPVQHVVAELGLIARNHRTLFVVRGARDEPSQLRLAVALATAADPTLDVLSRLRGPLAKLPGPVSRAIALALERPEDVHRVSDLAFATGKSERTLNRWLDTAGLHSAGYFVTAAHLLYAYRLLRQPRSRIADVADRLGYASVNHFREAVRRAIRCSPRELRQMDSEVFAETVASWLARAASVSSRVSDSEPGRTEMRS
jgi:AraC-like DNA-binding protein